MWPDEIAAQEIEQAFADFHRRCWLRQISEPVRRRSAWLSRKHDIRHQELPT
jgi:hypothetical protein